MKHEARFAVFEALITLVIVSAMTDMPCDASLETKMFGYSVGLGLFSLFFVRELCVVQRLARAARGL